MNKFVIVALLALHAGFSHAADNSGKKFPNVLVILADDLGYGDVQCNNPTRGKIKTPNIDISQHRECGSPMPILPPVSAPPHAMRY